VPKELAVKVNRRVLQPDDPPVVIHHVNFHRLGGEILMEVGFHDMATVVRQVQDLQTKSSSKSEPTPFEIDVTVFARYGMGAETFARLRHNVEEIYRAMVKSGHFPGEEPPNEVQK
jgi:hypothetical protein